MFIRWQTLGTNAPSRTKYIHLAMALPIRVGSTKGRRSCPLDADVLQRLRVVFSKLVEQNVCTFYVDVKIISFEKKNIILMQYLPIIIIFYFQPKYVRIFLE